MAHFQNQYGAVPYADKPQTDEYGNPIQYTTGTGTGLGVGHQKEHHGITEKLHRSGSSSSSSSSEDDGHGGRRKKGLKEKIKEKIPGHKDPHHATSTTTTPAGGEQHHEKKGIIGKIKDKLPGGHHHDYPEHHNY